MRFAPVSDLLQGHCPGHSIDAFHDMRLTIMFVFSQRMTGYYIATMAHSGDEDYVCKSKLILGTVCPEFLQYTKIHSIHRIILCYCGTTAKIVTTRTYYKVFRYLHTIV